MEFKYPPSLRLKRGWEFDAVFRTGSRHKGALVRLLFIEAPDGKTRFGVVVGKKQGNACVRSRGRRVLREAARRLAPWVRPGYWFVLSLSYRGLGGNARDVYVDVSRLMERKGFLSSDWPGISW
ncbi:ribonuclease P protein component [Dethiosulfovibrio sp. F2B]|uniref:ribonuclease P protein component n=1 Tax=Dethiosulfovibrio faecalis TaxID=2720018 RepID=UPI001F3A038C|nr:ribonuclease P protein component [Dethiosulfovibrio faecalis]MCF4152487.1 ribonuclease P protein component [Dethiosulfovibrio faecalis]